MNDKLFSSFLNDSLAPEGFKKQGAFWRLVRDEIISVVNVQKSKYDDEFFLNLGFWIREIGPDEVCPKVEQCHVQGRAEAIFPSYEKSVRRLHSSVNGSDDSESIIGLKNFLINELVPFIHQGHTQAKLAELVKKTNGVLVRRNAHELLGYVIDED